MNLSVNIQPNVTANGTEYMTAERQVLSLLASWKCFPHECAHFAIENLSAVYPRNSYFAFMRNTSGPEGATILLYIPDDHPSALMAKLKWGGK